MPPELSIVDEVEATVQAALARDYRIEGFLGRGGMSIVFLARELSLNRAVAMKVLPLKLAREERAPLRFKQEATIAASLDHPHVTPVHRIGETPDFLWYTMKYIRGLSLEETLRDMGRLDYHSCLSVVEQAASALDHAHRRGIVHRDMKPGNVLLDENSWAYVSDFGVAKAVQDVANLTQTGGTLGTPAYMSPEQLYGKQLDGRSDQYALAVMTFELLAGRRPFEADSVGELIRMHCSEPPPLLSSFRSDLPDRVSAGLLRGLAKEPEERFDSVIDFLASIGGRRPPRVPQPRVSQELSEADTAPITTPDAMPVQRRVSRVTSVVAAVAAVVLVIVAVAIGSGGGTTAASPAEDPTENAGAPGQRSPAQPSPAVPGAGRLFVNTNPWGQLYVDGERMGNTPMIDVPIAAGTHEIRVTRDGFVPFVDTVRVAAGGEVRLTGITLERTQ